MVWTGQQYGLDWFRVYGFVILLDEGASESHTQKCTRTAAWGLDDFWRRHLETSKALPSQKPSRWSLELGVGVPQEGCSGLDISFRDESCLVRDSKRGLTLRAEKMYLHFLWPKMARLGPPFYPQIDLNKVHVGPFFPYLPRK